MITEEIEKAGWEYANKSIDETTEIPRNTREIKVFAVEDFTQGAKFMNKYWQEKTRWIPVEEKLPLRQSRTRQIFCKNKYIVSVVFISCGDKGYLDSLESLKREFTHWKEID